MLRWLLDAVVERELDNPSGECCISPGGVALPRYATVLPDAVVFAGRCRRAGARQPQRRVLYFPWGCSAPALRLGFCLMLRCLLDAVVERELDTSSGESCISPGGVALPRYATGFA